MVNLAKRKFRILDKALPKKSPVQIPTSPHPNTIPRVYVAVTVKMTSLMIVHIKLIVHFPIP